MALWSLESGNPRLLQLSQIVLWKFVVRNQKSAYLALSFIRSWYDWRSNLDIYLYLIMWIEWDTVYVLASYLWPKQFHMPKLKFNIEKWNVMEYSQKYTYSGTMCFYCISEYSLFSSMAHLRVIILAQMCLYHLPQAMKPILSARLNQAFSPCFVNQVSR